MTRGNQRELARAKAAKKGEKGKSISETEANKGLTLEQRRKRDADALKEKQAKNEAKKAEAAAGKK